jgi:hypothetical protein
MAIAVTLTCAVSGFPLAYYMARHACGAQKALLFVAVMLRLWSSYLVRVYAWKLLLAKEGAISWSADRLQLQWLLDAAGLKAGVGHGGAVTLIQRFGSAANLNIHLHCLVLDGVYRHSAEGASQFMEVAAPSDEALQGVSFSCRLTKVQPR